MNTNVLTGLRFWAAAIVVIFHFGRDIHLLNIAGRGFFTAGPQMVGFFFVLSGFIMAHVYLARENFRFDEYLVARFARIMPVYILALFALTIIRPLSFWQFFSDLSMLKAWFPQYAVGGNSPGWSISVEIFFYALFPFIIYLIKDFKFSAIGFAGAVLVLWFFSQIVLGNLFDSEFYKAGGKVSHGLIFYFPVSHLSSFFVGIATALVLKSCTGYGVVFKRCCFIVALFSAALIYWVLNSRVSVFWGVRFLNAAGGLAPLFALFIFSVVVASRGFEWLLANRVSVALGEASYALYILQLPVFLAFNSFFVRKYSLSGDVAFWLYFVSLLLLSVLVYFSMEVPVRDFVNKKYRNFTLSRKESYAV
ncbi:acyltransferase family protein [Pseudomonas sp. R-28-1W-6]|uniref:acyltransferase family protein n=1 Tax=Pseudomonas sp. R-28-1W-6 TaxID=2650101 RepID=UPI0013657342|nr:acyltransferase [Pseudomonas sp. R-28-1W-6]MWV13142.1 acyltransferase family protein [Pseudomonas sp. R-28-1W-6]